MNSSDIHSAIQILSNTFARINEDAAAEVDVMTAYLRNY